MKYWELIDDVYCEQQVWELSAKLDLLAENIYKNINFAESLDKIFSPNKKKIFLSLIKDEEIAESETQKIAKFVDDLKTEIKKVDFVSMEMAFEPSISMIKKWSDWINKEIDKKVFLKIIVNKQLLAGAKISFAGKFGDYSIRKHIANSEII